MSKYVVTGGAGFIGGHITEYLVARGENVLVYDNLSTGNMDNLAGVAGGFEFIEGDICDLDAMRAACSGADYVIHHAAEISTVKSVEDPVWVNKVNVEGTLNVLIAARDAGAKRAILASSSAVYGDTGSRPQNETVLTRPLSPYGATKACGEQYCGVFQQIYGLETVCLRYFNVFGPRQNPASDYAAVIPKFVDRAMSGKDLRIYGDGEQTRDFVFVTNVARANYLACTVPGAAGKILNIAGGKFVSVNQLAEMVRDLSGKSVSIVHEDPKVGDIKYSVSDISLAKKVLGYEPEVAFEDGLAMTVDYFARKYGR